MEGRLVTNDKGDTAFWDGKNLTPARIEPGTTGLEGNLKITDEPTVGREVVNAQGNRAWWDGKNLKPLAVGQAEQMEKDVSPTGRIGKPMPTVEPIQPKPHRPPGVAFVTENLPQIIGTVASFNPYGRAVNAAIGAGTSVAQDLYEGKTPSVSGAALGGLGGAVGPEVAKAGKALYRGAAGIFGRGPLKKAAGEIYETTKGLAKPTGTSATETALLKEIETFGRTATPQSVKVINDQFDKIAAAKMSGRPLTYGEVFNNATQVNQHIDDLLAGKFKEAGGQLKRVQEAMMADLAASGPEAAQAVESYKRAIGMFGGYTGVVKAMRNIGVGGIGVVGATSAVMKPATLAVSGPAALLGGMANLTTRLPFGAGQAIAHTLITDPGKLSTGAARALSASINEFQKGLEY